MRYKFNKVQMSPTIWLCSRPIYHISFISNWFDEIANNYPHSISVYTHNVESLDDISRGYYSFKSIHRIWNHALTLDGSYFYKERKYLK